MDPLAGYNNIGPGQNLLFNWKFLNLEYIFYKIYVFLHWAFGLTASDSSIGQGSGSSTAGDVVVTGSESGTNFLSTLLLGGGILRNILYILILIFITVISYVIVRMLEVRKKEKEYIKQKIKEYAEKQKAKEEKTAGVVRSKNPRWEVVIEYLKSGSENDWKLGVMEADSMLDSLLDQLGFRGESLGEKLKFLNKEEFRNLNFAWEAHAVRNRIAHEGSDFILTQKEANRIVALYEMIFRDYDYI